ncbi:hypothetical protein [Streptomyces sp. NPDC127119]|uniref:hypothetical protein n=1 Tax=Streptomyces sp. NPDC127119 TaxID=3345370 RepID=UPI00363DF7A8
MKFPRFDKTHVHHCGTARPPRTTKVLHPAHANQAALILGARHPPVDTFRCT